MKLIKNRKQKKESLSYFSEFIQAYILLVVVYWECHTKFPPKEECCVTLKPKETKETSFGGLWND